MNTTAASTSTPTLNFDNRFTRELPADSVSGSKRRQVTDACYSRVTPTSVSAPKLVAFASEVAELIGLPADAFVQAHEAAPNPAALLSAFSGNTLLAGMDPYACCYGGHQFGNWAGQLGDGRAINLGEVVHEGKRWALQLKGAGPTPYSRSADGLAVLRSSVREFLCSEAMHHLGVPTTRALSLVTTGEEVLRDMFYDGHPKMEPGAIVCRVAPSFTRFGSFEIHSARDNKALLQQLVDYTITTDFPELGTPSRDTYLAWLAEVSKRTAVMVAHWMRVGFVHGVMNTDNMSVLGLTIDYGPYGWLEDFDLEWTPNTTDAGGRRYRYGHQAQVALWNLVQLANALYPLIEEVEPLQAALDVYARTYQQTHHAMQADKLGLAAFAGEDDVALFGQLESLLGQTETDMTLFYNALADVDLAAVRQGNAAKQADLLRPAYYNPEGPPASVAAATVDWLQAYAKRAAEDVNLPAAVRAQKMHAVNPRYVLRNYLAQLAIDDAEQGDFSLVSELLDVLRKPYEEQPGRERFAEKRPEWARTRAGCSMLSCSS